MSPNRLRLIALCLLTSVLCPLPLPAAESASATNAAEIKRVTERYALTRSRISALLDLRQNPLPLPANAPNPFYQTPKDVTEVGPDPIEAHVPEVADITDIDTLRRLASTLRIGGAITRNNVLHLTINNVAYKVGDVITVGNRDRPTYLKLTALALTGYTLQLNDASLDIPLKL